MPRAKSLMRSADLRELGQVGNASRAKDAPRKKLNLMMHCGAQLVRQEALLELEHPMSTRTHVIVPHVDFVHMVLSAIDSLHVSVVQIVHALSQDGMQYFGMIEIRNGQESREYSPIIGLRNSHDKRFSAGVVLGNQVVVCDNLSFSGEVSIQRRHTRNILKELPSLILAALESVLSTREIQQQKLARYRERVINSTELNNLCVEAWDRDIINAAKIARVIEEYRSPRFDVFVKERNVWGLLNAFTHVLKPREKGLDIFKLAGRTTELYMMLDTFVQVGGGS